MSAGGPPPEAVTAATKAVRRATLKVPCPEDEEIAIAVLEAAAPLIAAEATAAQRERGKRDVALEIQARDRLLDGILENAGDRFDGDAAAESIAVDYVRWLEGERERCAQLEQLAAEMLATYHKTSDGYRGRVGQVQIGKWQAVLDGRP